MESGRSELIGVTRKLDLDASPKSWKMGVLPRMFVWFKGYFWSTSQLFPVSTADRPQRLKKDSRCQHQPTQVSDYAGIDFDTTGVDLGDVYLIR